MRSTLCAKQAGYFRVILNRPTGEVEVLLVTSGVRFARRGQGRSNERR
jgi:hypothetical protein